MIYKQKLWRDIKDLVKDGDTLIECQLSQLVPHTMVGAGIENVTIQLSNCGNCNLPESWVVDGTNYKTQWDNCSHLIDGLPYVCEVECRHVSSKTVVTIDVEKIVSYEHENAVGS